MPANYILIDREEFDYTDHVTILELYDELSPSDRQHVYNTVMQLYNVDLDDYYFNAFGEVPDYLKIKDLKTEKNLITETFFDNNITVGYDLKWDDEIFSPYMVSADTMDVEQCSIAQENLEENAVTIRPTIEDQTAQTSNVDDSRAQAPDSANADVNIGSATSNTVFETAVVTAEGFSRSLVESTSVTLSEKGDKCDFPVTRLSSGTPFMANKSAKAPYDLRSRRQDYTMSLKAKARHKVVDNVIPFKDYRSSKLKKIPRNTIAIPQLMESCDTRLSNINDSIPSCSLIPPIDMDWEFDEITNNDNDNGDLVKDFYVKKDNENVCVVTASHKTATITEHSGCKNFSFNEWFISVPLSDGLTAMLIASRLASQLVAHRH